MITRYRSFSAWGKNGNPEIRPIPIMHFSFALALNCSAIFVSRLCIYTCFLKGFSIDITCIEI